MTNTTQADVVVIVRGEDCDGNPVPRAVRAGYSLALRGEFGQGFDVRGPSVVACHLCLTPVFTDTGAHLRALQDHHWDAHGSVPALLP
ncbi:MAG: hypothetical protein WC054_00040 [Candidatus Nanopelagicales bacterium]